MADRDPGGVFDFVITPALRLPPMLRDTLAVIVLSFSESIRAPGFCQDLYDAVVDGRIDEARRILRGFGIVAITPHANTQAVHVLGHALESAFKLAEAYAASYAEWREGAQARAAAARGEDEAHHARVERLLEYIAPPGHVPPRKARKPRAPKAPEVIVVRGTFETVTGKGTEARDGTEAGVVGMGNPVRGTRRRRAAG